jgi:hypothetical protein
MSGGVWWFKPVNILPHLQLSENIWVEFYVLLTVNLDAILGNDQLDALCLNVFILCH